MRFSVRGLCPGDTAGTLLPALGRKTSCSRFSADLVCDLNLTDVETCYKMVRTDLLKASPWRARGVRNRKPELAIQACKTGCPHF